MIEEWKAIPGCEPLTDDEVRAIRIDPRPRKEVGLEYKLWPSSVTQITERKTYAYVNDEEG